METAVLVALVIGFTQVIKTMGITGKLLPLVAVVLGIGFNFATKALGAESAELALGGAIAGLTACGLWDLGRDTIVGAIFKK